MGRRGNVKMAWQSITSAKWRSLLTMLGIIIGVVSVVTTVSLGEGVKQQIRSQIDRQGADLITVLPGQRVTRNQAGQITSYNPLAQSSLLFSEVDYKLIESLPSVALSAPLARVPGAVEADQRSFHGTVLATTPDLPELLNQEVEFGAFFDEGLERQKFAVIGRTVAENLFGEIVPIGKSFTLRDQTFIVSGIFEEFDTAMPIALSEDYNRSIFIPYEIGRELMGGTIQIHEIMAKPNPGTPVNGLVKVINDELLKAHANQPDFTVLKPEERLALTGSLLNLITSLIAGVAAISLVVGGIGIMNIMLVSVSERTGEIGIRKAVGATNRQIWDQFLTEAVILALAGGLMGVFLSVLINFLLRVFTDLQPVITLPIMLIAVGVALLVGAFFGATPALRAARKDPIEALRYE